MDFACNGCLNNVPKLTKTDPEIVKCYRSMLEDKKIDVSEISLCWECKILIHKFIKFKRKVQYSYNVLEQLTQNDSTHKTKTLSSSYQQKVLHIINYNPTQTPLEGFEIISNSNEYIIKTEFIKEESDIDHEENNLFGEPIDNPDTDNIDNPTDNQKKNINKVLAVNIDNDERDLFDEPIDKLDTDNIDYSIDKQKNNVNKVLAVTRGKSKKVCTKKSIKNTKERNSKIDKKVCESKEVWFKEVHLTEKEVDEERTMLSRDSNYVNAIYKCVSCIESFPNSDDMKDHADNKHNVSYTHKCPTCACTFASPLSYTYHRNRHTVRLECTRCISRFSSRSKVARHYEDYHLGGRGFGCGTCQVDFSNEIELCMHKRTQQHTTASSLVPTPPRPVAEMHCCKLCEKSFKWRTSLNKHLEKHRIASGLKRRPFCEICSLTFTHSASLTKHVKTSWKHQMLLQERNAKEGQSIVSASVREKKFICALCDKRFQLKGNLQRHVASHAARAAGELVCVPCDRTFSSIATYQQHMKISRKHVSEDDFQHKCSQCEAKFVSKSKLRDHVDWEHLKNYTHSCDTCKKVFKSHTSLYLHTNTVHGKQGTGHLCDHCGKSFPVSVHIPLPLQPQTIYIEDLSL